MATVKQDINVLEAILPATAYPQFRTVAGTNFPVPSLAYDASTAETAHWTWRALNYGSGNLTVRIQWYADTASTGGIVLAAAIAAITPNTDTQDIETDAYAAESTTADTHLGTTGQRVHELTITVSNLDSVAAGDWCMLRITRNVADGSDDMTGDAHIVGIQIEYSDA